MVYKHPSRGCAVCIKRKKKCDEVRPSCGYCQRRGIQCPGAKVGLIIVEASVDALRGRSTQQSRAPVNDRAVTGHTTRGALYANTGYRESDELAVVKREQNATLFPSLPTKWHDVATSHSLPTLSEDEESSTFIKPWVTTIIPAFTRASRHSSLENAVAAFSLEKLSKDDGYRALSRRATTAYGRCLRLLAPELNDPTTACSNQTLATMLMILQYGFLCGDPQVYGHCDDHLEGLLRILVLRGKAQLEDPASSHLFFAIRELINHHYYYIHKPWPPQLLREESKWFFSSPKHPTLYNELQVLALRLPELRADEARISRTDGDHTATTPAQTEVRVLLARSVALYKALQAWYDRLPQSWRFPAEYSDAIPSGSPVSTIYTYPSTSAAISLTAFQLFKIYAMSIILTCLGLLPRQESGAMSGRIIAEIRESASAVFSTLAAYTRHGTRVYAYGQTSPICDDLVFLEYLSLPIRHLFRLETLEQEERDWLLHKLMELQVDYRTTLDNMFMHRESALSTAKAGRCYGGIMRHFGYEPEIV